MLNAYLATAVSSHTKMSKDDLCVFIADLYQRYQAAMLRRARKYVHNSCDAEDVVSDCWVSLIRHAERLRKMVSAAQSVYIMRCVENRSIDFLRSQRHYAERICDSEKLSILSPYATEPDFTEQVHRKSEISHFLYLLPPKERKVIELRMQEWTTDEIAAKLHITKSSVRGYAARATTRLRSFAYSAENREDD